MTSKDNRIHLLYYIKHCASFQSHRWIQTGITVRKCSIRVKIGDFLSCVTLKFDGWPWKSIGHLFYTTSSFLHHFKAISKFQLEFKSESVQFGSTSTIFLAVWPRNLTDDLEKQQGTSSILHQALCIISKPSVNSNWCYSPETPNLGQNRRIFVPCDLEIWWMTLKNNRAPLLCYFKPCASFQSHLWIQTGVRVRKGPFWVKIGDFSRVTLIFDKWPRKTIGHLFWPILSFVHHFVAIGKFKLEL